MLKVNFKSSCTVCETMIKPTSSRILLVKGFSALSSFTAVVVGLVIGCARAVIPPGAVGCTTLVLPPMVVVLLLL